jgi:hypothetical protein
MVRVLTKLKLKNTQIKVMNDQFVTENGRLARGAPAETCIRNIMASISACNADIVPTLEQS